MVAGAQAVAPREAPQTHPSAAVSRVHPGEKQSQNPGAGLDAGPSKSAHPRDTLLLKTRVRPGTAVQGSEAEMTVFGDAPATPSQPLPWNRPQIVPVG